jgi:hypothetical protein
MITDKQVGKLKKLLSKKETLERAAVKSGMDEKTARKYRDLDKLPSEIKAARSRDWKTHEDSFAEVWGGVEPLLELNPGLEAKTIFEYLQRQSPGCFEDAQLRTFQRRVKNWRAVKGHHKEVFFSQIHQPGKLAQSDFTHMEKLGITIAGQSFDHLIYHFVLTYSNWETGTICFSESFESLNEGLQNALHELGGIPEEHQTDRLTTAVNKADNPQEFTQRYQALMDHYHIRGRKTQPSSPNENGDIEQRHYRFKKALDQILMLRGSREFSNRKEYSSFLEKLFEQLNSGRKKRFSEEQAVLRGLPNRLDLCTKMELKVGPSSTIRVKHNVYSVDSRLIGELITVRLYAEYLEVWHGQRCLEKIPRLRGTGKYRVNYRHIIDWLVRKPGAFENYRYQSGLFPTSRFRMAYDFLKKRHVVSVAAKQYLRILHLAAKESESLVDDALRLLLDREASITAESVEKIVFSDARLQPVTEVAIGPVMLENYDQLLQFAWVTA